MASNRVWILEFIAGNPDKFTKVRRDPSCPLTKAEAMAGAKKFDANGWRAWVFHAHKGDMLWMSEAEKKWHADHPVD